MRMWVLPGLSVAMAVAVTFLYLTTPAVGGEAENPMLWASDDWVVWEQLPRAEAATRAGNAPLPESRFVRRFVSASGDELWHMDQPWMALPEGWKQQMWRGGWLSGVGTALDVWREDPQDMARHWREGEDGAKLMRTAHGWALESEGWVVWSGRAEGVEAEGDGCGLHCSPRAAPRPLHRGGQAALEKPQFAPQDWTKSSAARAFHGPLGPPDGRVEDVGLWGQSGDRIWRDWLGSKVGPSAGEGTMWS